MVADFKARGLEHSIIYDEVFDVWSEERMRLLGFVLLEKMQIFPENKTGIICLTKAELERFHASSGDTEGMVNYPLSILGMPRDFFDGGGHFNAAGGRSSENMEKTLEKVKRVLQIN
jgi:phosphoesterase RecJ-like protein